MCRWSEPWVRVEATRIAKPVPASHAEKVNMRIGTIINDGAWLSMGHIDRPTNIESIMLSKHSRADTRWVRWKARPSPLRTKAE